MAQINILTSSYNGKLGTTYGTKQYKKHFVKAIPFSHAPHNEMQKNSVRAFTKLNKICSQIVKKYWQYLGLSDKSMYKNNALTQKLKSVISDKIFDPTKIYLDIPQSQTIEITETNIDNERYFISARFIDRDNLINGDKKQYLLIVFSESAITYINETTDKQSFFFQKDVLDTENDFYYFLVLSSKYKGNKKKLESKLIKLKNNKYVVKEIWYVMRLKWDNEPYVEDEILYLKDENVLVEGDTLVIK